MNICMPYKQGFSYYDKLDEVIINYNSQDEELINFLQENQDKKIDLIINTKTFIENNDIVVFKKIQESYPQFDFSFVFIDPKDEDTLSLIQKLKENYIKYNYFFKFVACDWDQFLGLIELGVSEIYIGENLGFDIVSVAETAKELNIKIRAYPNIAQSSWGKSKSPLKNFFIRPEDVEMYSPYIDTLEFFGKQRLETYYRIYFIDKKWDGDLKDLIIGLDQSVPNNCILSIENRLTCGKRCLKNNNCNICDRLVDLADSLKNNNLYVGKIQD